MRPPLTVISILRLKAISLLVVLGPQATFARMSARKWSKAEIQKVQTEVQDQIIDTAGRELILTYTQARTKERFIQAMSQQWTDAEKKSLARQTKGQSGALAPIRQDGRSLVVGSGEGMVRIDFVDPAKHQFRINDILWTFDPEGSRVVQLEALLKLLEKNHANAGWWIGAFLPEARAATVREATIGALILLFVGGSMDRLSIAICNGYDALFGSRSWNACPSVRNARLQTNRELRPRLDPIDDILATDGRTNILSMFSIESWGSCPNNNDGKDKVFNARIKVIGDNTQCIMNAVWGSDNRPKGITVTDAEHPERVLFSLVLDKDRFLENVEVLNPEFDKHPSADTPRHLPVSMMTEIESLDPQIRARVSRALDLFKFMKNKMSQCIATIAADRVRGGERLGSTAVPVPTDTAVRPTVQSGPVPASQPADRPTARP